MLGCTSKVSPEPVVGLTITAPPRTKTSPAWCAKADGASKAAATSKVTFFMLDPSSVNQCIKLLGLVYLKKKPSLLI